MTQWRERKKRTDSLDWEEHLRKDRDRKKAKRALARVKILCDRKYKTAKRKQREGTNS